MSQFPATVYEYIRREIHAYQTREIVVADNWYWNMYKHIQMSFHAANSQFYKGPNGEFQRPFDNIIRPITNVAKRAEGFGVKNIDVYIDNQDEYYKSFLVRKYHDRWAWMNSVDGFLDELVESYVDYGLALLKHGSGKVPEVVPLQRIAFCDQADVLAGPICETHNMSIDELLAMKGKWDDDAIDDAIAGATDQKENAAVMTGTVKSKGTGAVTPVYELHGILPTRYLSKEEGDEYDVEGYTRQAHYVMCNAPTKDDDEKAVAEKEQEDPAGYCLWSGPEKEDRYKAIVRDKIYGRACGFGAIEELMHPQVWVNYTQLKMKAALDAASLTVLQTADKNLANRNRDELDTNEIVLHEEDKPLSQLTVTAVNYGVFTAAANRWMENARTTGAATDAVLGDLHGAIPFRSVQLQIQQALSMHEWRQGQISEFVAGVYRDWILPDLVIEMNAGQEFESILSHEELLSIVDIVTTNRANAEIEKRVLAGEFMTPDIQGQIMTAHKGAFMAGGNRRFLSILKDEIKDIPTSVHVNVNNKQKDFQKISNTLTSIFKQVIATPQIFQIPGMTSLFNELIESSGFSPIDFSTLSKFTPPQANPALSTGSPIAPKMPVGV